MRYEDCLDANGFEIISRAPVFILMNTPMDIENGLLRRYINALWVSFMRNTKKRPFFEAIGGAILYWIDGVLTRIARGGPTTELIVCRFKK